MAGGWRKIYPSPPRDGFGVYRPDRHGRLPALLERIRVPPSPQHDIDTWIARCQHSQNAPQAELPASNRTLEYLLNHDRVRCVLHVVELPGEIDEPFQDPSTYNLHLTLHVDPSAGFLGQYSTSPTVILDSYTWQGITPKWKDLKEPVAFLQPRAQMLEIMACLAKDSKNESIAKDITTWCSKLSIQNITARDVRAARRAFRLQNVRTPDAEKSARTRKGGAKNRG